MRLVDVGSGVTAVRFAPDGMTGAVGDDKGRLVLWDVAF
jgi:hypothetical protein